MIVYGVVSVGREGRSVCFCGFPLPLWTENPNEGRVFLSRVDANAIAALYGGNVVHWEVPEGSPSPAGPDSTAFVARGADGHVMALPCDASRASSPLDGGVFLTFRDTPNGSTQVFVGALPP